VPYACHTFCRRCADGRIAPDCRDVRPGCAACGKPPVRKGFPTCPQEIHKENQWFIPRKFARCAIFRLRDSGAPGHPQSIARVFGPERFAKASAATTIGKRNMCPGAGWNGGGTPGGHWKIFGFEGVTLGGLGSERGRDVLGYSVHEPGRPQGGPGSGRRQARAARHDAKTASEHLAPSLILYRKFEC
jgi:hypothetical protein